MTGTDQLGHLNRHLPAMQFESEVGGFLADREQMHCGDYHLALRDKHAVHVPAVDEAGDAADIARHDSINDVSRQTEYLRYQRIVIVDAAHETLPGECAKEHATTYVNDIPEKIRSARGKRFRIATCSRFGTEPAGIFAWFVHQLVNPFITSEPLTSFHTNSNHQKQTGEYQRSSSDAIMSSHGRG